MTAPSAPVRLAVHLDGTGWHPASWSEPGADPAGVTTARHWLELITPLDAGRFDLVTFSDRFGLPVGPLGGTVGRVDPLLLAARLAPVTRHVGLPPTGRARPSS